MTSQRDYAKAFEQRLRNAMGEGKDKPYMDEITPNVFLGRANLDYPHAAISYIVLRSIDPNLAAKTAALAEASYQKLEAIREQDFEKAANVREDLKRMLTGLGRLLK